MDDKGEVTPSQKSKSKSSYETILSLILFFFSLAILFFTLNYFFHFFDFSLNIPLFKSRLSIEGKETYALAYLSGETEKSVEKEIIYLLEKRKNELKWIDEELKKLELDKKEFLRSMGHKQKQFHENLSLIDNRESLQNLKTIDNFYIRETKFNNEVERRIGAYLEIYQKRHIDLEKRKEHAFNELMHLTRFMKELNEEKGVEKLHLDKAFVAAGIKMKMYNRILFFIEKGEYQKALKDLDTFLGFDFDERETVQKNIVREMLFVLQEYQKRLNYLRGEEIFDEIKMSYLNEDYSKALAQIDAIDKDAFTSPLLSELRSVLYTNMDLTKEINEEIELKNNLKVLGKKALEFERKGDYEKALKIYEDLLILNLPAYDREYLIQKIHAIMLPTVKSDMKRKENTEAIKLLGDARSFYREGREKKAAEVYAKLIKECPNSDYIGESIEELLKILGIN